MKGKGRERDRDEKGREEKGKREEAAWQGCEIDVGLEVND